MEKKQKPSTTPTIQLGAKSVQSPPAQSPGLLHPASSVVSKNIARVMNIVENKNNPQVLRAVIRLQISYGLRISEVLNISSNDITSLQSVYIRGSKGSNDRIIQLTGDFIFWSSFKAMNTKIGNMYSRWFFYRAYKKMGINYLIKGNEHHSVTHLLRHLNVASLDEVNVPSVTKSNHIGHKSKKSIAYYERLK